MRGWVVEKSGEEQNLRFFEKPQVLSTKPQTSDFLWMVVWAGRCEDGKYVFIEDDRGEIGCLDAKQVLSAMTQTSEVLIRAA